MEPLSNQQSTTSCTLVMVPPHCSHFRCTSSTYGLCNSMLSSISSMALSTSSFLEPTLVLWPQSSQIQILRGVPQNLVRDIAQSFKFSSQLPKRPSPTNGGYHSTLLLFSISLSLSFVISIYQLGLA